MDTETGYDEWLSRKLTETLARVDARKPVLHEHADAMALLKKRLEARLSARARP